MFTFIPQDMTVAPQDRPKVEVTREEFVVAASMAGWEQRTIDLYLKRDGAQKLPIYVGVGGQQLRILNW